ncbi:hypothetical protein NA57DRAFT_57434 [Rhizodiscina lignyota]|uniref:BTB domain-containing protein n=1 Tax=Rhizodiscina lignyota TaxID=1504668 RepID=A0A9P4M5V6_9PEZI|nr:hypothetical protein NA57DRAFT_57434 [Rhizodiscina lignyota]
MAPVTHEVISCGFATLVVGPDNIVLYAYVRLLCDASPFFAKPLQPIDNERKVFLLPDDEVPIVSAFVRWLYDPYMPEILGSGSQGILSWVKLWVFAEKVEAVKLQNQIVDYFIYNWTITRTLNPLNGDIISWLYRHTKKDCILRRLVIDMAWCHMRDNADPNFTDERVAAFPREFVNELCASPLRSKSFVMSDTFAARKSALSTSDIYHVKSQVARTPDGKQHGREPEQWKTMGVGIVSSEFWRGTPRFDCFTSVSISVILICRRSDLVFIGELATIVVGLTKDHFHVHAELLIAHSPFFKKALRNDSTEGKITTVELPDHLPATFAAICKWLYSDKIDLDPETFTFAHIAHLWVLADKLQIPKLQNDAMRLAPLRYARLQHSNLRTTNIDWVYTHTVPGSPLRRVVVDLTIAKAAAIVIRQVPQYCREYVDELCQEFLARLEGQQQRATMEQEPGFSLLGYTLARWPESLDGTTKTADVVTGPNGKLRYVVRGRANDAGSGPPSIVGRDEEEEEEEVEERPEWFMGDHNPAGFRRPGFQGGPARVGVPGGAERYAYHLPAEAKGGGRPKYKGSPAVPRAQEALGQAAASNHMDTNNYLQRSDGGPGLGDGGDMFEASQFPSNREPPAHKAIGGVYGENSYGEDSYGDVAARRSRYGPQVGTHAMYGDVVSGRDALGGGPHAGYGNMESTLSRRDFAYPHNMPS